MRNPPVVALLAVLFVAALVPFLRAQAPRQRRAPAADTSHLPFNPHDLNGVWHGDGAGNGRWDNPIPEPALTEWAKKNLLYESISHDPFSGKLVDPKRPFNPATPAQQHNFFVTDLYGVRANDINGEYPGKDCEPLAPPAMYDYPGMGGMELLETREGDRIFQLVAYHREWRTFWLNREHPKDPDPSYEGDSVAHWDGTTLVVDTVGFNGKSMVSGAVGHRKSDAFRLEERFRRVDHDHLRLDMTFYDSKAWGDKPWPGFVKYYELAPPGEAPAEEFICSPREYIAYESGMAGASTASPKK